MLLEPKLQHSRTSYCRVVLCEPNIIIIVPLIMEKRIFSDKWHKAGYGDEAKLQTEATQIRS